MTKADNLHRCYSVSNDSRRRWRNKQDHHDACLERWSYSRRDSAAGGTWGKGNASHGRCCGSDCEGTDEPFHADMIRDSH